MLIYVFSDIQKRTQLPVKDVNDFIKLKFQNESMNLTLSHLELIRPNHPTNCLTLDLLKTYTHSLRGLYQIQFHFKSSSKYQIEVQIEDRLNSLSRAFKYNKFGRSGPRMELDNLNKSSYRYYSVQFNQKKFTERDPGKKCKNYHKTSFDDCDQEFFGKLLKEKYPPGFLPLWATNNLSTVTTLIRGNGSKFSKNYEGFILGDLKSDCLAPCTSTEITSVFLDEKNDNYSRSKIDITFSEHVSTVLTDFPKFNAAVFLSSCGGSMGMWLGVSVLQTAEVLWKILWKVKMDKK